MKQDEFKKEIASVLEHARYAPSVHNTQPWQAKLLDNQLEVSLDTQRMLRDGDPTHRESTISLGIFCEAICMVAPSVGLTARSLHFQNGRAHIIFERATEKQQHSARDIPLLLFNRCSDRSVYRPIPIPERDLKELAGISPASETNIHIVTNNKIIKQTAVFTSKAMGVALSTPGFRKELLKHITRSRSGSQRGISTASLNRSRIWTLPSLYLLKKGWLVSAESDLEQRRWESAGALAFITAKGDMPHFWFNTGITYMRVALAAERLGLRQATSAAIVEASNYHEDIEKALHTQERILSLLRLGYGSEIRHRSPRIDVEAILH